MYKFSAPMAYTIEDIDRILDINNNIEKSRITSLYACLPSNCELFTGFEQSRNFMYEYSDWDYWKQLIEHTLNKNCDFIYLLNNPQNFNIAYPENLKNQFNKLDLLLKELKKAGVNKLRVASPQLMTYLYKNYKDFNILASTSLEFKTIWEYENFIQMHSEIKQIVPSHDVNKNFKLLSNTKKSYPYMEIELMVNEGCIQGCPHRNVHESSDYSNDNTVNNDILTNSGYYCTTFCKTVKVKYPIHSLVIGTHIFPWDIEEYSKIGINNFKLVGRDGYSHFENYLKGFNMYLKGIDDTKSIGSCSLSAFTHHLNNNPILKQLTVKEYKKYLPDIKRFIKYGHLCASR